MSNEKVDLKLPWTVDEGASCTAEGLGLVVVSDSKDGIAFTMAFDIDDPDDERETRASAAEVCRIVNASAADATMHDPATFGAMFEAILDSARAHGESGDFEAGATHEVGDLQDAFRLAWDLLPGTQRAEVYRRFRAEEGHETDLLPDFSKERV